MTRIDTSSYWIDSTAMPRFSPLKEDIAVDVLVVGAGMTGVTAAYLAKRAGMTVALVDRGRCGLGETAFTTAHLTCVTDKPLSDLSKTFGRDHAQAAWDAGLAAIDTIDRIAWREQIKCQFEWVPAYLYDHPGEPTDLEEEATLAAGLGFDAQYFDAIPLIGRPGIRYGNQAKFHPRKYLSALVRLVPGKGSYVFENTNVEQIESSRITATTDQGHRVHCGRVMIATHVPLQGMTSTPPAVLLQSKLVPYTTYVVGGWTKRGTVPEALFWETRHAYDYLRVDRRHDHDFVIFGGRDHKTGQVQDTAQRFEAVEQRLKRIVPDVSVTHRWSGQVIDTTDGLPYIGETAEGQFVATGFCGNGITFGTLGAMMFVDKAAGRKNPWEELFDPHRTRLRSAWNYIKQNADYPYYMIRDRFAGAESRPLREVARGTGQVLEVDGQAAAVYRGLDGKITVRSAVCTHMGCHVQWNNAERTWDCPCHGSRFKPDGEVVAGPAETPLEPVQAVSPKP